MRSLASGPRPGTFTTSIPISPTPCLGGGSKKNWKWKLGAGRFMVRGRRRAGQCSLLGLGGPSLFERLESVTGMGAGEGLREEAGRGNREVAIKAAPSASPTRPPRRRRLPPPPANIPPFPHPFHFTPTEPGSGGEVFSLFIVFPGSQQTGKTGVQWSGMGWRE